ncbi:MAG: hypothetical protein JKY56_13475 [Kofleriaceae bacterium]|nr:hypothetical protein [Kofleriaceae bacterium]
MSKPIQIIFAALLTVSFGRVGDSDAAPRVRATKANSAKKVKSTEVRRKALSPKAAMGTTRLKAAQGISNKTKESTDSAKVPQFAIKLRESMKVAIEANFKKFPGQAEALPKERTLYHSIKEKTHRDLWQGKYQAQGTSMIGEWMSGGKYGGIWTTTKKEGLFGGEGWYSDKGNGVVRITLKKNALFLDLHDPAQKKIYTEWQKLSGQDKQHSPTDLFLRLKAPDGTPMSKRVGAIGAPKHGDFLMHMGIAGVIHYDTYGRGNPVLLNPHAIEKVEF